MTVEADIVAALTSLVSGRVYADTAGNNTTKPFITFQQVGGRSVAFLETAVVGKKNGRFQINTWHTSRTLCAALSRSVADALVSSTTLRATPLSEPIAEYDDVVNLYGASQDFSIWF